MSISIRARLFALIGVVAAGLFALVGQAAWHFYSLMIEDTRMSLANNVEAAYAIMAGYADRAKKGEIDLPTAKKMAVETIKMMRYGEGGYFIILNRNGVMVMHPTNPELDGKDLSGRRDRAGNYITHDWINVVSGKNDSGYLRYYWGKPGAEADGTVAKESYIKLFKPWGYIIGTGVYIDDLNQRVWKKTEIFVIFAVGLLIVLMVLLVFVIRSISCPLDLVKKTILSLADGNADIDIDSKSMPNELLEITNALTVFRDSEIERKKLEELVVKHSQELEEKAQELEKAYEYEKEINERQRQFVSMASHEFRTPLAIIDSSAQRLARNKGRLTETDVDKRVDKIRRAVTRMTELMESTLAAAKSDTGKIEITPVEGCDLRSLLLDCGGRYQEVAGSHTITFDLDRLPDFVYGDRIILDQVFSNLLSNAIKYSPGEGEIKIAGETVNEFVRVSITDYGLGIDQDDLPRLFERFFRAKTSIGIAGTGIGLNLAKMFVEAHGGSITVESRRGEGSCFTVELPCYAFSSIADREADAA